MSRRRWPGSGAASLLAGVAAAIFVVVLASGGVLGQEPSAVEPQPAGTEGAPAPAASATPAGAGTPEGTASPGGIAVPSGAESKPSSESAPSAEPDLGLSNEYIEVVVNRGPDAAGRFAIRTTGGDPTRPADDRRPLTYGDAHPWTSYTTVRIDGVSYVVGGATQRRAGRAGRVGQTATPLAVVDGRAIEGSWNLDGVEVLQRLSFVRGSTTGLPDTTRIEYVVTNRSAQTRMVGLRIALDTMAGSNDGAPFRVGGEEVTSDRVFNAGNMPEFWQAFDSLVNPSVTVQGTLRGADVTLPDRVYFTNWGSLADGLWDFDFAPGREFIRSGEGQPDSALALYYDPRPLEPGASRSYVAYYGLGGISISPGNLSLALTSPASVQLGEHDPIRLVAYVENTGEGEARLVKAKLNLPAGLVLPAGSPAERELPDIPVGETVQVEWWVFLTATQPGELRWEVSVEAATAEANRHSRTLRVVSPARLEVRVESRPALQVVQERLQPVPFEVRAEVSNVGGSDALGVIATLETPADMFFPADGESRVKYVGTLGPSESYTVRWLVRPTELGDPVVYAGELDYQVTVRSRQGLIARSLRAFVPQLPPRLFLASPLAPGRWTLGQPELVVREGEPFLLDVVLTNVEDLAVVAPLEVSFDARLLELPGGARAVDRGMAFVSAAPAAGLATPPEQRVTRPVRWAVTRLEGEAPARVSIVGESGAAARSFRATTLATFRFVARQPGRTRVAIEQVGLWSQDGRQIQLDPGRAAAAGAPIAEVWVTVLPQDRAGEQGARP